MFLLLSAMLGGMIGYLNSYSDTEAFAPAPSIVPRQTQFNCSTVSEIPQSECEALVTLYEQTGGVNWIKKMNWLNTATPCSWHGITCENGHIIDIGLGQNNLVGSIPDIFGGFQYLQRIGLHHNSLTDSIPQSLSTVETLTIIRLDHNQLSGTIPLHLTALPALARLNLSDNQFTGEIPRELSELESLDRLILSTNALTGTIPAELTTLTKLTKLYLNGNQLTGTLPIDIGDLINLEELHLAGNQFSGEIPVSVANLTQLDSDPATTDFGYNQFISTNQTVRDFLQSKDPDWEQTQTVPPTDFQAEAFSTSAIGLSWSPIPYTRDEGYYAIEFATSQNGPSIPHGVTEDKLVRDYILDGLQPSTTYHIRLRTVTLPHNLQSSELKSQYVTVMATTKTITTFACANVTEIPVDECQALVSLYNNTGGKNWTNQAGWLNSNTPCQWYGISCNAGHVTTILLQGERDSEGNRFGNGLKGSLPSDLHKLSKLITLRLDNNSIGGAIPGELGQIATLEKLNLGNNRFHGTIPDTFANLPNLRNLSLNNNQFSGEIPTSLGTLASLEKLYLHYNLLTGALPAELCNRTGLLELWIVGNALDALPNCLTTLSLLSSDPAKTDFGYNKFAVADPALRAFLDAKDPDWEQTQTIPPIAVSATSVTANQVTLEWQPIPYQGDGGHYEISRATTELGPFEVIGSTVDKSSSSFTASALTPDTTYYFKISTFTPAHAPQQNDLYSTPITLPVTTPGGIFSCTNVSEIPEEECQALIDFYSGMNSPDWEEDSGWRTSLTPCSWHGITCRDGRVVQLDLSYNHLNGSPNTVASIFSRLTALQKFNLSGNNIDGQIPAEIGSLSQLRKLIIANNKGNLTGNIPTELGNLSNLQVLDLSDNQLEGPIPVSIGNLTELRELYLHINKLSRELPPELCSLPNLISLNVSNNMLSGAIPSCLLETLESVNLNYNVLYTPNPATFNLIERRSPFWLNTQTIAPTNFVATALSGTEAQLTWEPIDYVTDGGFYEIGKATNVNGPYTIECRTTDKLSHECNVSNLAPSTQYHFRVRTYTPVHGEQQNELWSDYATTTINFEPLTATPTKTPTSTPTATPSATAENQSSFLPIIMGQQGPTPPPTVTSTASPSPTPTATNTSTPTSIPQWQQIGQFSRDVDVVAPHITRLFIGDRSQPKEQKGIYWTSGCGNPTAFNSIEPKPDGRDFRGIYDMAFLAQFGLAAVNGDRAHYSKDNGENWTRGGGQLDKFVLAVAIINNELAYAGADEGIYVSYDQGMTWLELRPANGSYPDLINMFTFDAATNVLWIGALKTGVWMLNAGTDQFTQKSDGLSSEAEHQVWDILIRENKDVYIATTNGVYRKDHTDRWNLVGLPGIQVLALEDVDGMLYAGTKGRGVWHTTQNNDSTWQQDPTISASLTVRDLMYDPSDLCRNTVTGRKGLLAATTDGVWVLR